MTDNRRPRIVIASQEVWPFVPGGGIGRHVAEVSALLAQTSDVTILTDACWAETHGRLVAQGDPSLPAGVNYEWAEVPPSDTSPFNSEFHFTSFSYWCAIRDLARRSPIDLIEFDDFRGNGAVTINAKRAGAPELAETTLAVRLHTSWEMTAVIDGQPRGDRPARGVMALERLALRFADRLLHPSEHTYDAYRRFYGPDALAGGAVVAPAFRLPAAPDTSLPDPATGDRLRLLYVGRLQALKGVVDLIRAVLSLPATDVELTLVGRDTTTAPGGGSMLAYLKRLVGNDSRVTFHGSADREELDELIDAHHVVVVPSRFESYGYVVREALARNRPVLATPRGGIVAGFVVGRSGWLARDASGDAIAEALADLLQRREEVDALIAAGAPRTSLEGALDSEAIVDAYHELARLGGQRGAASGPSGMDDRVTAIVLALRGDGPIESTLTALEAQQHAEIEIVVVADDISRIPATEVARMHRLVMVQPATGRSDARRAALASRVGRGPVLLLSAGHAPAPGFVTRCLSALASAAAPAYATAHGTGRDPANAPIGNAVGDLLADLGVCGEVVLLSPVALADEMPSSADNCDDATLFRELAAAGRFGAVIPEPLAGPVRARCRDPEPGARAMALATGGHELWTPD